MAEGSAAVALLFEIALREGRRAILRSPAELWPAWAGGASPTGPLEGLLPIEGGERYQLDNLLRAVESKIGMNHNGSMKEDSSDANSQEVLAVEELLGRCTLSVHLQVEADDDAGSPIGKHRA